MNTTIEYNFVHLLFIRLTMNMEYQWGTGNYAKLQITNENNGKE